MKKNAVLCASLIAVASALLIPRAAAAQFEVQTVENDTYTASHVIKGLECVKDVGGPDECAVPYPSADEGGYPWTTVNCRSGDTRVSTSSWSLGSGRPIRIFEAPAALSYAPKSYSIDVRLVRTCMKASQVGR